MKKINVIKKATALSLTAAMVLGLAACAGTAETNTTTSQDEVVELEFWGWWSSEARKPHIEYMVNQFNESQDRIRVNFQDIPWGDIFTKNIAQIAAGNPCDVIAGHLDDVSYRASQNQLTALDDYMGDFGMDRFYDTFAQNCYGEDGKVYAFPLTSDTRFIYYNKKLLAAAGVSEENGNLPKTWDELQELAYKLDQKNADGTFDVVGFHPTLGGSGCDPWIVNASKGQLWYDDEGEKLAIATPENEKALNYILSYTEHYGKRTVDELMSVFDSGMSDPFCSEKLAMLVHTNAYPAAIKKNAPDLDYGVMVMPEMTEGNGHFVNGGGFVLDIPYGAKHPQESMEFIKFMCSPEMQAYWAKNMGGVPPLKGIEDAELEADPVYVASVDALEETFIGNYPNQLIGFKDLVKSEMDLVLSGQKSPTDALTAAEEAVRGMYGVE